MVTGILDDFFGNEWVDKTSSTAPAVNVIETDKEYKVEIAAPDVYKRQQVGHPVLPRKEPQTDKESYGRSVARHAAVDIGEAVLPVHAPVRQERYGCLLYTSSVPRSFTTMRAVPPSLLLPI